jgi:hypothetical protein
MGTVTTTTTITITMVATMRAQPQLRLSQRSHQRRKRLREQNSKDKMGMIAITTGLCPTVIHLKVKQHKVVTIGMTTTKKLACIHAMTEPKEITHPNAQMQQRPFSRGNLN